MKCELSRVVVGLVPSAMAGKKSPISLIEASTGKFDLLSFVIGAYKYLE